MSQVTSGDAGDRLGWGSLTAVLVGLGHLGKLLQLLGTVLPVAFTFPLLTGFQSFLDNIDDFLINFAERKKEQDGVQGILALYPGREQKQGLGVLWSGPSTPKIWASPRKHSC